jgi:hypothetical protein
LGLTSALDSSLLIGWLLAEITGECTFGCRVFLQHNDNVEMVEAKAAE